MEVIEVSTAVLHSKVKRRNRLRRTYTLADSTRAHLKSIVASREVDNMSRAIDICVEFYVANNAAVPVRLKEGGERAQFLVRCLTAGLAPAELLATLARKWIATPSILTPDEIAQAKTLPVENSNLAAK